MSLQNERSKVQTLILSLARPFADALLRNVVRSWSIYSNTKVRSNFWFCHPAETFSNLKRDVTMLSNWKLTKLLWYLTVSILTWLCLGGWSALFFAEEPLLVSQTEGCQTPAPRGCSVSSPLWGAAVRASLWLCTLSRMSPGRFLPRFHNLSSPNSCHPCLDQMNLSDRVTAIDKSHEVIKKVGPSFVRAFNLTF